MFRRTLQFLYAPDEPAGGAAEPVAADAPGEVTPPPETPPAPHEAPAPAPWAADRDAMFADEASRAAFDTYMREKNAPYITKLEAERAELRGKAWVYDGLSADDPSDTIREIVEQVYSGDVAEQVIALIEAGVEPEAAAEIVGEPATDLSALPKEVQDAVAYAKTAQEKEAAAAAAATAQTELDAAKVVYDEWRTGVLKDNTDIPENDLHAYVYAAEGDMEQGLANYRATHPKPEVVTPPPPATLRGSSLSGIAPSRATGTLADAFGDVYDAARVKHQTI